jgi:hypothetical protein
VCVRDDLEVAARVRAELEASRSAFHGLVASLTPEDWNRRSANPAWTNGQVLFHIALGFFLVVPLIWVMRLFAMLPPAASKFFAACLDFGTPVFNWINALGPRLGAAIFGPKRLASTFDAVHRRILEAVETMRPGQWSKGMYYPVKWEPRFAEFMTFEKLLRYPGVHLEHHRAQMRTK